MIRLDNQCQGKHPYPDKESANITATHLNRLGGRRLNSYKCGVCGKFHIGHNSKGRKLQPHDKHKNKQIDYVYEPGLHIVDIDKLK